MAESERLDAALAFQIAACAQLQDKLELALRPPGSLDSRRRPLPRIESGVDPQAIKTVVCSGGVAANMFIRARYVSPPEHSLALLLASSVLT